MALDYSLLTRRLLLRGGLIAVTSTLARPSFAKDPLDTLVSDEMTKAAIPGLAVGVTRNGKLLASRTYGLADIAARRPVTSESMFHIASITKTVTALAIMQLVDQQRITLDDPIAPYLDFVILGKDSREITFRHLLTHTSGISDARYYEVDFREPGHDARLALRDLLRSYLAEGGRYAGPDNVRARPGATWDYSNIGYGLLGYLGSRITARDLRDVTREKIFRPLSLHNTAWTLAETPNNLRVTPYEEVDGKLAAVAPVGFPDWPAGMLRASIGDLTRLVAVAANAGVVEERRIISSAAVAEMLRMQHPPGLATWLTGQGLGWQQSPLGGVPTINHWGGDPGVFTMAYIDASRRIGVAILSNMSATTEGRDALKAIAMKAMAFADAAPSES